MPVKGKIERGRRNTAFTQALREFNGEIARTVRMGPKIYFTKDDCRAVYDEWGGNCSYCGLPLIVRGTDPALRVHFMLYQPFKAGGKLNRENVIPVCKKCKERHTPLPRRGMARIPNVNTLADLIDRLIVEVHKLAFFENKKREEHGKENPNVEMIAEWDNLSRDCCEMRSILKREINAAVSEFVYTLNYAPKKEARTFRPPRVDKENTIGDIVSEMCINSAERCFESQDPPKDDGRNDELKSELAEALTDVHVNKKHMILRRKD